MQPNDGVHALFQAVGEPTQQLWGIEENLPPVLSNGYVTPTEGGTSTLFYYYVDYYDPEGVEPQNLTPLCIDGSEWHAMSLHSGSASDGTYRCTLELSESLHNYYFKFSDDVNTVYLPSSAPETPYLGPNVDGGAEECWIEDAKIQNMVDTDDDGYYGKIDLCWDANTNLDQITVDVQITFFWYFEESSQMLSFPAGDPYVIIGSEVDWHRFTFEWKIWGATGHCDFMLELYDYDTGDPLDTLDRGEDPDITNVPLDGDEPEITGSFYDAKIENIIDNDEDGYYDYVDICWDADTNIDELPVIVNVIVESAHAMAPGIVKYVLHGSERDWHRFTVAYWDTDYCDVRLELYDNDYNLLDVLDFGEDPDITNIPMDGDHPIPFERIDLNDDGEINIIDVSIVGIHYGKRTADPEWESRVDINLDGVINIIDLAIVASHLHF